MQTITTTSTTTTTKKCRDNNNCNSQRLVSFEFASFGLPFSLIVVIVALERCVGTNCKVKRDNQIGHNLFQIVSLFLPSSSPYNSSSISFPCNFYFSPLKCLKFLFFESFKIVSDWSVFVCLLLLLLLTRSSYSISIFLQIPALSYFWKFLFLTIRICRHFELSVFGGTKYFIDSDILCFFLHSLTETCQLTAIQLSFFSLFFPLSFFLVL